MKDLHCNKIIIIIKKKLKERKSQDCNKQPNMTGHITMREYEQLR